MSVDSLIIHEKVVGIRDAQFHAQIKSKYNFKQNSPRTVVCMDGTRCFGPAVECACWLRRSKKLYHSVWEPPIMYVAWKILRSLGCYVDNESIPLKILFISVSKTRALAPLQIPASLCEGPIYLLLLPSHHPLIKSTS